MNRSVLFSAVALAATTVLSTSATAGWFEGQPIQVNGSFTPLEEPTANWGTWVAQGLHDIGGFNDYNAIGISDGLVMVESSLISEHAFSIILNYSDFPFFEIGEHVVTLPDLKAPGALAIQASASSGQIKIEGTSVIWSAQALDLPSDGQVKILIEQVPAPGALGMLAVAALGARRRRS